MKYKPKYKIYTTLIINKIKLEKMYKYLRSLKLYDTN